ncbi:CrcB family protein [Citricoccus sp.]|uniref:CrcB family protein n=1 Tax=Citricoccus sp. TaxID=1978372 RepID=UPI0028BDFB63|nr:CrcB family protein [Citricoccus sp.]
MGRARHPGWAVVGAVAAGGALGTLLRWLLVLPAPETGSPVAGWISLGLVNLSGSFLLGLLAGISSRRALPRWLVAGLGVGVLGSYTSLSAVVLAASMAPAFGVMGFIQTGSPGGILLVAGLVGTFLALAAGATLGTACAAAGLRLGGWSSPGPRNASGGRRR